MREIIWLSRKRKYRTKKLGCPIRKSGNKLSVLINKQGEIDEHIRRIKANNS